MGNCIYVDNGIAVTFEEKSRYEIFLIKRKEDAIHDSIEIKFQEGTAESGINGLTNESLLSIIVHRLYQLNSKISCVITKSNILDFIVDCETKFLERGGRMEETVKINCQGMEGEEK